MNEVIGTELPMFKLGFKVVAEGITKSDSKERVSLVLVLGVRQRECPNPLETLTGNAERSRRSVVQASIILCTTRLLPSWL